MFVFSSLSAIRRADAPCMCLDRLSKKYFAPETTKKINWVVKMFLKGVSTELWYLQWSTFTVLGWHSYCHPKKFVLCYDANCHRSEETGWVEISWEDHLWLSCIWRHSVSHGNWLMMLNLTSWNAFWIMLWSSVFLKESELVYSISVPENVPQSMGDWCKLSWTGASGWMETMETPVQFNLNLPPSCFLSLSSIHMCYGLMWNKSE